MKKIPLITALTAMTVFGFCDLQNQSLLADAQNSNYNSSNGSSSQDDTNNTTDEMYGFRLQGEALYWKTTLDNQAYTVSSSDPTDTAVFHKLLLKDKLNLVGIGDLELEADFRFDERNWGLDVVYTQLHSKASNSVAAATGGSVDVPNNIEMALLGANYASNATEHFNNKIYVVDGLIERKYEVGSNVEFYPAIGVKGAWFRQTDSMTYTGGNVGEGLSFNDYLNSKFSGAGPKVSLASKWMMGCGFSFYNKLGTALLFGNSNVSQTQTYTLGEAFTSSIAHKYNRTIPVVELLMGLEYCYTFEDVSQALGINVGFDGQYYFDQYMVSPFSTLTTYAGLGFYGVSFGASWHF